MLESSRSLKRAMTAASRGRRGRRRHPWACASGRCKSRSSGNYAMFAPAGRTESVASSNATQCRWMAATFKALRVADGVFRAAPFHVQRRLAGASGSLCLGVALATDTPTATIGAATHRGKSLLLQQGTAAFGFSDPLLWPASRQSRAFLLARVEDSVLSERDAGILPALSTAMPSLSRLPGPKRITQSLDVLPTSVCRPLKMKEVG